jgi:hypothetical protein
MNPAAPSAAVAGAHSVEADGFDAASGPTAKGGNKGGNGNGNGNSNPGNGNPGNGKQPNGAPGGQAPTNGSPGSPSAPGLKKVEIEGLISAKGGDSITVNGQQVVVPPTCPIRHGSTMYAFADLHIGDRVHVRATKVTSDDPRSPATTTLEATEVKFQNPGEVSEGDEEANLVSVAATDAVAIETGANTGTFTLTRSGNATLLAAPLSVTFTLMGTAVNGTDYTNVPLTASFAAGATTTTVVVSPIADGTTEGSETVILVLGTTTPYEVGSPASATLTISDTATPLVSVEAFDSTASETPIDTGTFRFTRTGSTAAALTVAYTVEATSTAAAGTDYTPLTLSVTFAAGSATADVTVTPLVDADAVESPETVIVKVTDGATYDLGATPSATVTISQ